MKGTTMTIPTTPDPNREYVKALFGTRPEPRRPDESEQQYFVRSLFHDPERPEPYQTNPTKKENHQ